MLYIVGIGPGNKEYILPKAVSVLNKCNIILGFSRAIESIDYIESEKIIINSLEKILNASNEYKQEDVAIVASGDPTFYGITNYFKKNYIGDIKVIPGISSFQYLTCKLNMAWNNAFLGSLHGREEDFIENVRRYKISIWLTDKKNNPAKLSGILIKESIDCNVIVGENLSYENEVITQGSPKDYIGNEYSDLSILIVENLN
ncbi:precorrin-6y C5,15-methyltransferase (decarboxylating) subunit CbiE [Clostridium gasigenes]|uniref:Precorrin-6Y C5,15-methyltransferase (Decarboxylating) n=1 Tax=Clostridium gasigenes TaxID=94869 RepID=A0A1H0U4I7_9CLOT|nr:precorrin-6y C5,15-methyltransferase (decarboxylating) subunit CbiE [Clostridium gasigenes]MBB6622847.1 precorrin-6y C5,15-methyltransferase (decarboxylating) subunit CbiE [Clostridium gasigenes]MBU3089385.1 precorrin-6y C5,15-methyltransferase (decarboxylating) subunit CbiE [Clostridium gasigenes]NKF06156.1 precorrin-6y C5,15-methyltransferase (decarboxylating) subunit CbiE [Clostridium gasigenes]QSW20046.1 precorrin-6y C5,15-methyltransferase (decarboxylating) subunit CbiE [Clostridium gas